MNSAKSITTTGLSSIIRTEFLEVHMLNQFKLK